MKIFLLTINLLLLATGAFSQENKAMYEFTESKEIQIQNTIQQGRSQIVTSILRGDHSGAENTLQKLIQKYGDHYIILYPREEVMIALTTRNFETFADSAMHYDPVIPKNKRAFVFEDFRNDVHKYLLTEISLITDDLDNSDLPEREKAVAEIYIHFLFSDNISLLNKEIKTFKKEYSRTLYTNFFNSLKRAAINSRINFGFGFSYDLIGGRVSESYYDRLSSKKLELDGFIKQTYISLYFAGGFSSINNAALFFRDENDRLYQVSNEKVSIQKYGFKLGKVLYSSENIKLYPYLSIGGIEISPPTVLYESGETLPTDLLQVSSFFAGFGASCDILLKKWKPKHMYDPEGYFFIRPNVGYDRLFTETQISKQNNLYFSVSLGVSIGPKK